MESQANRKDENLRASLRNRDGHAAPAQETPAADAPQAGPPPADYSLGFLVNRLNDAYEIAVFSGITAFTREHALNLVCFIGGEIDSPIEYRARRNSLYQLAGIYNVDGIIGLTSSLSSFATSERMAAFYQTFAPLPTVSIGQEVDRQPCVTIDNQPGLRALLIHLIEIHGARRIAFIKGHPQHADSLFRLEIYRGVLAEYGIPFDENLVLPGLFTKTSGRDAVAALLDERRQRCDAIFAVNDNMAIGAIKELKERGISVPGDMAVAGFDDIAECSSMSPGLTTVRQPLWLLGYRAAEVLFSRLATGQEPPTDKTVFPTELVVRESCGCRPGKPARLQKRDETDEPPAGEPPFPPFGDDQSRTLLEAAEAILAASSWDKLRVVLHARLHRFGAKSCYISLFEDHAGVPAGSLSRVRVAIENGKLIDPPAAATRFLTQELVPGGLRSGRGKIYLVLNLYSQYRQLGFVVYEIDRPSTGALESLTMEINNAVNRFDFAQWAARSGPSPRVNRSAQTKYQKSRLRHTQAAEYYRKIVFLMEKEKIYRRPDLSVRLLSKLAHIPGHNISYVINTHAKTNFYRFVNMYRVREALSLLRLHPERKLIDVAFAAGFKAKSTFNKFFKEFARVSPSEFVEKNVREGG
jgi:DNA-binding LacI/PurR family transcriptional regulator/AraC-like DNA-binding protein